MEFGGSKEELFLRNYFVQFSTFHSIYPIRTFILETIMFCQKSNFSNWTPATDKKGEDRREGNRHVAKGIGIRALPRHHHNN